jgi:hypothetical protein
MVIILMVGVILNILIDEEVIYLFKKQSNMW